jgi:hypothetical protein
MANVSVWEADASVPAASVTGLTAGRICYAASNGSITGSSSLYWDATNSRLGVGTASPDVDIHCKRSASGSGVIFNLENLSGTAGSDCRFTVAAANSSGGDPYVLLTVVGSTDWCFGVDNSDSDTLKWDLSSVGGATKMKLDTSGNLTTTSNIYCKSTGDGVVFAQNFQVGTAGAGSTLNAIGNCNDGASAVGVNICNTSSLTTAGAKICSFWSDNRSTEKAYITKDGVLGFASTAISANNAQTVTVSNVGPGGAGVSIQEWLQIKNAAGTTRYLPLFG